VAAQNCLVSTVFRKTYRSKLLVKILHLYNLRFTFAVWAISEWMRSKWRIQKERENSNTYIKIIIALKSI